MASSASRSLSVIFSFARLFARAYRLFIHGQEVCHAFVEPDVVFPDLDGQLSALSISKQVGLTTLCTVHFRGELSLPKGASLADPDLGVRFTNAVRVKRIVEMAQWQV